jgi:hypothetical protein
MTWWGDILDYATNGLEGGTQAGNVGPNQPIAGNADNGLASGVTDWLFGNAPSNQQSNALFSSGWPQILANLTLIIIGFVIFTTALKTPPIISTTVNVVKSAVTSGGT